MKVELENKLFKKYPKIFRQKELAMTETAMCWGISTGDGWYWLINNLCNTIQKYIGANKKEQVEATQVKEKYGGLRFYYCGGSDLIDGMVWLAESMSYIICEQCGSIEGVTQTKGWIVTLCKKCMDKRNESRK